MAESITDELRGAFDGTIDDYCLSDPVHAALHKMANDIADRIDQAYDDAVTDAYSRGWDDSGPDHMSDTELARWGLVRLPVDKDGKIIHPGDTVKAEDGEPFKVKCVGVCDGFYNVSHTFPDGYYPDALTHYKPSPAERIRSAIDDIEHTTYAVLQKDNTIAKAVANLKDIADELEGDDNE